MSATAAPFGLTPVNHPSGQVRPFQLTDGIASGYGTTLYQGRPVKFNSSGQLEAAGDDEDFIGSFAGVQYTDAVLNKRIISNVWAANATYVAGSLTVTFFRDPQAIYAIQADGPVAQTAIGAQFNFSNLTAGNSTTGISGATMSATPTVSEGQVAVVDIADYADNAWGDAYPILYVRIARSQDVANKVPY